MVLISHYMKLNSKKVREESALTKLEDIVRVYAYKIKILQTLKNTTVA